MTLGTMMLIVAVVALFRRVLNLTARHFFK
jgi:hypothetical protein